MSDIFRENSKSQITILEAKDGVVKIKLDIAVVDKVNDNGRYYSRAVYEAANGAAESMLKDGALWGLIDHPTWEDPAKGSVEDIVIKYTKLGIEGEIVYAEGILVNSTKGRDLHEISKAGVKLGVSTNGYGSSQWIKASEFLSDFPYPDQYIAVMQTDFRYNTIDIVSTPSNSGGKVTSMEGTIMNLKELQEKDPAGYAKLMAEAKANVKPEPTVAPVANTEALEKQVEALTAKLAQKDAQEATASREALAVRMLAEAGLPKLPVEEGAFDVNASFEARVKKAAVNAASEEAAKEAINAEIAERKLLTSHIPKEIATENGVILPESRKQDTVTEMVSLRGSFGLL